MTNIEWKECTIGDIADVQTGPFGSQLHEKDYVSAGTPIVTVEHLGNRTFSTQNLPMVSDSDKSRLQKYCMQHGDLIFSRVGSVDRCTYANKNNEGWLFSGRCLRVRPQECVDSMWLYYFFCLESTKTFIRNIAVGATMPSINTKLMCEAPVKYPPLAEQQRIAKILSSLDDKIELNNAINRNLEEQAQAIFKSWFIDFEPFGGEMPEDWTIGKLSDLAEYEKEKTNLSELTEETYYSTENMLSNKAGVSSATNLPTIDQTTRCFPGETIISNIRPYFKKIFYCTEDIAGCSTDVLCFKPKNKLLATYNYSLLYNDNFFDYMVKGSKGTKMPRGDKSQIMNYEICIPSDEYLQKFDGIVSKLQMQIQNLKKETTQLTKIRDTLLPELMSGDLGC